MIDAVPAPLEVEPGTGEMDLSSIRWVQSSDKATRIAELLVSSLTRITPSPPVIVRNTGKGPGVELVLLSDKAPPGSYTLESTPAGVRIEAGGHTGLLNGIQCMRQYAIRGDRRFPAAVIKDAPAFSWRGVHLDVSRHFFGPDRIRRLLDLMAVHKLNVFHWHLTDDQGWRIEIEEYPELTRVGAVRNEDSGERYGGFYTKQEAADIVAHAEHLGITVVPEVELPGHAQAAIASRRELACGKGPFEVWSRTGISKEVYCAGRETTFRFLETVFDEILEIFPSEFIHVGGDECPKDRWRECPDCQRRIRDEGLADENELQSYVIRRMDRFLASRNRRLIGWDEILEGGLAAGATVMSWRGTEGGAAAAALGHDAVMCPHDRCYFDYRQIPAPDALGPLFDAPVTTLANVYEFSPTSGIEKGRNRILGGQANIWTEAMDSWERVEHMAFPRLGALSEAVWLPEGRRDRASFAARLQSYRALLDALEVSYCDAPDAWLI